MRKIFFDTWAWIAMANGKDRHHQEALSFYKESKKEGGIAITTDYVLAETFSALRKGLRIEEAITFGRVLLKNVESGKVQLEFISEELFSKTWKLFERYKDKQDISFFDLSSIVVLEEVGVKEVFTNDRDFERVGLGYVLLPPLEGR